MCKERNLSPHSDLSYSPSSEHLPRAFYSDVSFDVSRGICQTPSYIYCKQLALLLVVYQQEPAGE